MSKSPDRVGDSPYETDRLCGFHSVASALKQAPMDLIEVLMDHRRHDKRSTQLRHDLDHSGVPVRLVAREELDKLAAGVRHQGVIATVKARVIQDESGLADLLKKLDHPALLLILDQVQDPHNLGACLRTADGAGVDAVILPRDGACPVNSTVARVAAGAAERLSIFYVSNLVRTMQLLKDSGIWITGAMDTADTDLYDVDFSASVAIALGAESTGLRRLTRENCDYLAKIPMSGEVSSLNVSVATGLFLYEAVRQRLIDTVR